MRKYVKVNVNFDLADDSYVPPIRRSQHFISIDPVATHEVLLEYLSKSDLSSQEVQEHKAWLVNHWAVEAKKTEGQQRFMAAIAALRESLRIDPDNFATRTEVRRMTEIQSQFDTLLARGKRLMSENQDTQAIETFQRLLQLKPSLAEAHGRLGTLYAKTGNLDRARESLRRSIEQDPDDQYGHSMLARLAMVSGDLESAIKHYRDADQIEPYNSKIHLFWGQVLIRAGRRLEALEHLRLSATIDPKQIEAHRGLCELLATSGNHAEALTHAKRLCELTSYQGLSELMLLAEIHVALGEPMAAASVANHAIAIAKKSNPPAADEISKWLRSNSITP
jgi:tetratricopeptide (TPR) repeat protein